MKTIKTIILVLTICVMNQFVNAQGCSCRNKHRVYAGAICDPNNLVSGRHYGCCVYVPCGRLDETTNQEIDYAVSIYPNPISNSTTIYFSLSQSQKVSLKIFDVSGRLVSIVADRVFKEGENELVWSAADVNAGVYFLQFQSAETLQTEKLIVTK